MIITCKLGHTIDLDHAQPQEGTYTCDVMLEPCMACEEAKESYKNELETIAFVGNILNDEK